MKFVKRPLSLPEPLSKWANGKVKRLAKETQRAANFSAYVATLIANDKAAAREAKNGGKAA